MSIKSLSVNPVASDPSWKKRISVTTSLLNNDATGSISKYLEISILCCSYITNSTRFKSCQYHIATLVAEFLVEVKLWLSHSNYCRQQLKRTLDVENGICQNDQESFTKASSLDRGEILVRCDLGKVHRGKAFMEFLCSSLAATFSTRTCHCLWKPVPKHVNELGMLNYAYNPSICNTEVGGSVNQALGNITSSRTSWVTWDKKRKEKTQINMSMKTWNMNGNSLHAVKIWHVKSRSVSNFNSY